MLCSSSKLRTYEWSNKALKIGTHIPMLKQYNLYNLPVTWWSPFNRYFLFNYTHTLQPVTFFGWLSKENNCFNMSVEGWVNAIDTFSIVLLQYIKVKLNKTDWLFLLHSTSTRATFNVRMAAMHVNITDTTEWVYQTATQYTLNPYCIQVDRYFILSII